ncbi:hypothetical protein A8F94_12975 [Bacillus sp. FJAT-27225]|uniref:hypothetical protein n=1 Tax=Bacillus sp. FJAT-27225 TaxID=1743144 RepID=UPI00080C2335|nr:hypothetical protein [Bacillus sp. FJAT-27225]OCA85780.1 hypothetical protein A8F94_12975 [Bacillus sp. FJAT-27225]
MNKEKFTIDYPDESEIRSEIRSIVQQGLPVKETFTSHLLRMYREIGIKYLFRDSVELLYVLFAVMLVISSLAFSAERYFTVGEENIYAFIFIVSPVLFLACCIISFMKLKQAHTFELEMTCKYNVFQLAGFRMLVFGIASFGLNTALIGAMAIFYKEIDFTSALLLSASSLILFSILYLLTLMKVKTTAGKIGFSVIWLIMNFFILFFSKAFYFGLLNRIPIALYILIIAAGMVFYIKTLKKFVSIKSPEGVL